jgi:hypothetical protein
MNAGEAATRTEDGGWKELACQFLKNSQQSENASGGGFPLCVPRVPAVHIAHR